MVSLFLSNRKTGRHATDAPHFTQPNQFIISIQQKMMKTVFFDVEEPMLLDFKSCNNINAKCFSQMLQKLHTKIKNKHSGKITMTLLCCKQSPSVCDAKFRTNNRPCSGMCSILLDLSHCHQMKSNCSGQWCSGE